MNRNLCALLATVLLSALSLPSVTASDPGDFTLTNRWNTLSITGKFVGDSDPRAVLVQLVDADGRNEASENSEWLTLCKENHIALIDLDIHISNAELAKASINSGAILELPALLRIAILKNFKRDLPVYMRAEGDVGSATLLAILSTRPSSLAGWCCRGGSAFASARFNKQQTPPGLLYVQSDSIWHDMSKRFFSNREPLQKWAWLSFKASDLRPAQSFVREYFKGLLVHPREKWSSAFLPSPNETARVNERAPVELCWFPNEALSTEWSKLIVNGREAPRVFSQNIDMGIYKLPSFDMYLRLPSGVSDGRKVSGVLAFCTWIREKDNLVQALSNDPEQSGNNAELPSVQMVQFAVKHNLALLTWSTPGTWTIGVNSSEVSVVERDDVDREFDAFATEWDRGVSRFCKQHKLAEGKFLLFGMSRGAQWAHRLALRVPKRFLAVNAHVSSSYDVPTPGGKQCLWLITTGELDPGLEQSKGFYKQCRAFGYNILFKVAPDLGHGMRGDVDLLRNAFFEYALGLSPKEEAATKAGAPIIAPQSAVRVGDYQTQSVLPIEEQGTIDEQFKVFLPTEVLADAWRR